MSDIQLLGGAFTATLVKSKSGSESWQYTPNFKKLGKIPYKGSEKEVAEFKASLQMEQATSKKYQLVLKTIIKQLVKKIESYDTIRTSDAN